MNKPQSEKVWVLIDGVGQPCLCYVVHRNGITRGEAPAVPRDLDEEFGPYRWAAYRLIPAEEAT